MKLALYALGVLAGSAAGFLSPHWYLGFVPLALGLVWAAYDIEEVADGIPPTPQRSSSD